MVLSRFPAYEAASRKILTALGLEIRGVEEFCCCGASLAPGIWKNWIHLPAYTLAQAERDNLDLLTLCGGCTNIFRRTEAYLLNDASLLKKVNQTLAKLGLSYSGSPRIRHLLDILEEILTPLQQKVTVQLEQKVALSPPCQVFRPTRLSGLYKTEGPGSMRRIAKAIGIQVLDYPLEDDCCGATLLTVDESLAIRAGASKLRSALDHGADAVCVACGNCLYLFDRYQKRMGIQRRVPIITLAQLVDQAMAFGDAL
jgi:heterodisulfide reductase subunit B